MRIAIVSDMHLGYERFAEDALSQAKEALQKAAELSDAILIPGDIFDKRYPKPDVIAQTMKLFREVSSKNFKAEVTAYSGQNKIYTNKPIIAIPGTHERIAKGKDNAVQLLSLAGLLVDTSEATTTLSKGNEKVCIFGLGGVSEERVKQELEEIRPKPAAGAFNIFMFHQSTYEMLPFSSSFIKHSELPAGFDLYVCGHIHSMVKAEAHGKPLLVPGSTVLTQLKSEEQGNKGFIIFDTDNGNYEFVKINSRPFIVKEISANGASAEKLLEECKNAISGTISKSGPKPIIKIKISGKAQSGFEKADIGIRALAAKYAKDAVIAFDTQSLSIEGQESIVDELREGKVDSMPVKELGIHILSEKLKKAKIRSKIKPAELFTILSSEESKDKVLKSAGEALLKE